jgi:uncharacterized protein YggT (Ycf19 family)
MASSDPRFAGDYGAGPGAGSRSGGDDTTAWVLRIAKVLVVFVYAVVAVCLVLLTLAFVLQLFGASTDAEFTRWVYRNADRVMEPFRGMFPSPTLSDRSVVDFSVLFAMLVYAMAALALHALISWLGEQAARAARRSRRRASHPLATGEQYGGPGAVPYGQAPYDQGPYDRAPYGEQGPSTPSP